MRRFQFTMRAILTLPALIGIVLYAFVSASPASSVAVLMMTAGIVLLASYSTTKLTSTTRIFFLTFAIVGWLGIATTVFVARQPVVNVLLTQCIWWQLSRGGSWFAFCGCCMIANTYLIGTLIFALLTGLLVAHAAKLFRRST